MWEGWRTRLGKWGWGERCRTTAKEFQGMTRSEHPGSWRSLPPLATALPSCCDNTAVLLAGCHAQSLSSKWGMQVAVESHEISLQDKQVSEP